MSHPDIFAYIKSEEARFQTEEVQVGDNWFWNLRTHVQLIFHMKHGQFYQGENGQTSFLRAFKNIMRPMLALAYWTEDIDVKDVVFFIEGEQGRVLSFLVKKYHDEVFVREHNLDTLFDEITEDDVDYGGVLVQKTSTPRPERVVLNTIAFCDQSDMLGAPLGVKHNFSPAKLREMASLGWGEKGNGANISINELITLADQSKEADGTLSQKKSTSTGKNIEVYIVKGTLPQAYLKDDNNFDKWYPQVHVVAFYTSKDKRKEGVCLYRKEDDGKGMKFHASQPVHGRALGQGEGEAILPDQVWTNFLEIHKTQMLQAGAKTALVTDDPTYTNKNKIRDMENLEITTIEDGKSINIVPTINVANIQLYDKAINDWYEHAQLTGSAFDPILGKEASSGTTFRGQERVVAQGRGIHDRRRGQRAKFIEELYRWDILPKMVRDITKGKEFLASLDIEEMTWVVDQLATNHANRKIKERMLDMDKEMITREERDILKEEFKALFLKGGNRQLIKILKDEFKNIEVRMGINIAGKQKDLVNLSDKLLSVFQFIFANPQGFQQAMQIPALSKAFTDILEFSGLNQADFASILAAPAPQPQLQQPGQPQQQPQPGLTLSKPPVEA